MTDDYDLEQALRATLHDRADQVRRGPEWHGPDTTRDAVRRTASGMTIFRGTAPSDTRGRSHRWRAPLLAAMAVIAVAVTTSAIATGGFGGDNRAATAGGEPPVAVPITCGFSVAGHASGSAGGPAPNSVAGPATGYKPSMAGRVGAPSAPSSSGTACTSPGSVRFSFDGAPPNATLRWRLSLDGAQAAQGTAEAQGRPTSYLSSGGALFDGSRYLWGAVGPGVAQVQIQALQPAGSGTEEAFAPTSAFWTIGSGRGTTFSLPGQDDVIWTALGDGWHGFAVSPPADTVEIDVSLVSSHASVTETRRFRFTAGQRDWAELPPQTPPVTADGARSGMTTTPPPTGATSRPSSASVAVPTATAPTSPPQRSAAEARFPAQCPGTRETGSTDIPETVRRAAGDWFGRGDLWVNAPRSTGPGGTKFATLTLDDDGEFTDSKGAPTLTARLLGGTATARMDGTNYSMENQGGYRVHFWPTTFGVDNTGTWLVTETLGATTLQFCMQIG